MKRRVVGFTIAGILSTGASAGAQIPNVQATFGTGYLAPDPGYVSNGYYVGPYSGSITIGSTTSSVVFNCVDFFHDVGNGQTWTATLTNLGTGAGIGTTAANSTTRLYGSATVPSTAVSVSAFDVYRAAAYLISTYPTPVSTNGPAVATIQSEIWEATSIFYPQSSGQSYYQTQSTRTDGLSYTPPLTASQLANTILADRNVAGFDYQNWWVVTISGSTNGVLNKDLRNSPQEFIIHQTITTSPEPGTLVLLGSGLFGVLGFAHRRRSKREAVIA